MTRLVHVAAGGLPARRLFEYESHFHRDAILSDLASIHTGLVLNDMQACDVAQRLVILETLATAIGTSLPISAYDLLYG